MLPAKDVSTRNTRELLKNDGFCRVLLRGGAGTKNCCGTLCVKNVTRMLREQAEFCGKDDITFQPGRESALARAAFPTMITNHIRTCYGVKKKVMGFCCSSDVRTENIGETANSFVIFVQIFF